MNATSHAIEHARNPENVDELKDYVVIGIHKENQIAAFLGTFDTAEEAITFTGIEGMQPESEGVEMSVYRKVD